MAVVQVAETLELREALARKLLVDMLWRQLVLMGVIAAVTVLVVQRATRPVRALGELLSAKDEQPEIFRWSDAGESRVTCTFVGGKLAHHELFRPGPDAAPPAP